MEIEDIRSKARSLLLYLNDAQVALKRTTITLKIETEMKQSLEQKFSALTHKYDELTQQYEEAT